VYVIGSSNASTPGPRSVRLGCPGSRLNVNRSSNRQHTTDATLGAHRHLQATVMLAGSGRSGMRIRRANASKRN